MATVGATKTGSWLVKNDDKYFEIFYPGNFTTLTADGKIPQNGWEKLSKEKKQLKAHPLYKENGEKGTIPIDYLLHATHADKAARIAPIEDSGVYTFEPHTKCGKKYDREEEGSYVQIGDKVFQKVKPSECVLPGKLSWWSPVISPWKPRDSTETDPDPDPDPDQQYRSSIWKAADDLKTSDCYLALHLSSNPESRFGDKGFVVSFKNLLNFYKESRTDIDKDEDKVVYLRIGGTLRYRYEICHVVIVCTKHDQELIANYPSLHYSEVFDHRGIVLESGQIKSDFLLDSNKSSDSIGVKPQHSVKWVVPALDPNGSKNSCYEEPAFAFYYPQESHLTLNCTGVDKVAVNHKCTRQCT